MNAENAPFVNRAITPYSVGSVFKAVVAAAAIEKGIDTDFSYTCSGSYTIGETVFNCHNRSGHGTQNMGEAMANSCNPYFIELALETGAENVCAMGENLGLGAQIELADGFYTETGIMPDKSSIASKQDLANLAFGQGQLLASPLQMAAVYAAIANNGIYRAPSLMQAIVDASGEEVQRAFLPVSRRAMSKTTAETVGELLHDTVENGSGKKAKPASCSAAGKTGTAQSGWINDDGTEVTQSWYCGYFPYEDPQYVVTVLKENGEGGGEFACGDWCRFCKAKAVCRKRAEYNLELAKYDFEMPDTLEDAEIAAILDKADELTAWAADVKEYALRQALSGTEYPGYKVVEGRSNRRYISEDAVADAVSQAGYDPYAKKVLGLTEMQKLLGKKKFDELLGGLIEKPQGKPVLVPLSDKRQPMNTAQNDFKD